MTKGVKMKTKTYWVLISILLCTIVLVVYFSNLDSTPVSTARFSPDISWVKTDSEGTHIGFNANHKDLEMICKAVGSQENEILNVKIDIWACDNECKKGWSPGDKFQSCYFVVTIPLKLKDN